MERTPFISFVIAYHNEPEALLRDCIESIQALPFMKDEAEIVVVDDGSKVPLSLPRLEEAIQDSNTRIMVIRQEESGLSVARNTGISQSSGRYIQFVDADDCLIPSAYEAVLGQVRAGTADLVMFRMSQSPSNIPTPKVRPQEWRGSGASFLQQCNLRAAACAYAFRRDILGDLRFYPGLFHEDELFTPLLFLRANMLVDMDAKAYFYRQHEGTITHSNSSEKVQKRLNDIRFIINELRFSDEYLLERRIRQLTVDYLQKSWTLTHSLCELHRRSAELRRQGFLPLPLRRYSPRYLFVAVIARLF